MTNIDTGVEIHGASGALIDQFIQDVSNNRSDQYGGSIENRTKFALDVVSKVAGKVGAERVGIKVGPWAKDNGALWIVVVRCIFLQGGRRNGND